jgi:hypothetical protein
MCVATVRSGPNAPARREGGATGAEVFVARQTIVFTCV